MRRFSKMINKGTNRIVGKEQLEAIQIVDENTIKNMIYIVRGQRVMFDFDLARIYGYTTKRFNEQVKRNIEKFEVDFMFQISKAEFEYLVRSQNATTRNRLIGNDGGSKYLPHAFTKRGIYMLMTVLKGELATQQSIALIRLLTVLEDYVEETNNQIFTNEVLKLADQVSENTNNIKVLRKDIKTLKSSLKYPLLFKHYVIHENERVESDIAYQNIYSLAKHSILLIDDYISLKTLELLKSCKPNIQITIVSDNIAKGKVTNSMIEDFEKDTGISISLVSSHGAVHDRYIAIDYKHKNERLFHCGASSKDSGNSITSIMEDEHPKANHGWIDELLSNQ